MKRVLKVWLLTVFCICVSYCNAQLLEPNSWNTFEGKIGNNESQLSLYLFKNNTVKGNYVFKKNGIKVLLTGRLKANALFLTEVKSRKSGLKGNLFTDSVDRFSGRLTDTLNKLTSTFDFQLSAICWGDYEHQYQEMFGSNEQVEAFMATVKKAILTDNKQWLASNIRYPIRFLSSNGIKRVHNQTQLIKYYDHIFTKEMKNKIRSAYTTNLFNKDGEAMLGNGEIWISDKDGSTKAKYGFVISAVN